ncbi:MAG: universal stress protein [Gammaproteobacteria bacterium]|nr:universal stress protein [Gammaproteobacteria bacterium]
MTYKHVLAAVDLSEEAEQVLKKAQATARSDDARLSVLTVVKPLTQVYGGLDMAPVASGTVSFEEEALKQALTQLTDLGARYGVAEQDIHVVLGAPAHEIRESSREFAADLIVIGTHGRHGLGLLLGSTANGVLHGVDCDVLAVRISFAE